MKTGETLTINRTFSQRDFDRFAALSGDDNPIHVDPTFAAKTKFGRTVAHGMFLYSNVCSVLESQLPGPRAVQIEQDLMFPSPTYAGETVAICLSVIQADKDTTTLSTVIERPSGEIGLKGQARIFNPSQVSMGLNKTSAPLSPETSEDKPYKGLSCGMKDQISRTFTTTDLAEYTNLIGDVNPIHTNQEFAQQNGFRDVLLPGGLLGGLFSYLLGTKLPGRGTNWLKQKLIFPAPSHPEQVITATVEIVRDQRKIWSTCERFV